MVRQHVSLDELQEYALDGEPLSPDARQHFDGCLDCQNKVARAQQTAVYLVSHVYRSQCPSATTLSYYCLPNGLTEKEQSEVANHLSNCPLCLAELHESRQFLSTSI